MPTSAGLERERRSERTAERGGERETERTTDGPGVAAVAALRTDGAAGAAQVVQIIRAHPNERDEIMAWLQTHRGNGFTQQVASQLGQVERALPEGIDLQSVRASVVLPGNRRLAGDWKATVGTTHPTHLIAEVTPTGMRVTLAPSLHVDATWPLQNADVRGAGIDFTSGRAFANVTDGRGLGSGMISIKDKLHDMITDVLDRGIAGTPLARPGYHPVQDPDLAHTLDRVIRGFQSLLTEEAHEASEAGGRPPIAERELDNVSVGATVVARAGGQFLEKGNGVVIGAGSSLSVDAHGDGSVGDVMAHRTPGAAAQAARITALRISASNMEVHAKGKPVAKIGALTVAPGGGVTIDSMQLMGSVAEARDTEGGLAALIGIIALAAGDHRTASGAMEYARDPKLVDGVTRATLEREFTSCIQKMVLEHRAALPGVDLARVLGIG